VAEDVPEADEEHVEGADFESISNTEIKLNANWMFKTLTTS
jgi:hypothetical protein